MERLYTPWRMKYVTSTHKKQKGCVFCTKLDEGPEADQKNLVLHRGETTFTVMNIFPYNTGHLMILPYEHISSLGEMSQAARLETLNLTTYFTELLTHLLQPDGFNIGMNLGRAAGAGIAGHLHLHIVPRWGGDNNFMAVVGETRILPETLEDTFDRIVNLMSNQPPLFED